MVVLRDPHTGTVYCIQPGWLNGYPPGRTIAEWTLDTSDGEDLQQ